MSKKNPSPNTHDPLPAGVTPAVAIIGTGYWGKNLVRNYQSIGALRLICDKNENTLQDFKSQYSGVETCLAFSDILKREDIEGVVIATPAETHYALAKEALMAGKHVYVEKPLVLDEADAEDLINLASENSKTLMVGHLLQYHPVFVRLKELTVSEQSRLRSMISARQHPDRIEAYLAERGYSATEIEEIFAESNVRRSHLLDCYRMKRNVRIIGGVIVLGSFSIPVFNSSGTVILVSLGLLVYGIALVITGSLTVYQP